LGGSGLIARCDATDASGGPVGGATRIEVTASHPHCQATKVGTCGPDTGTTHLATDADDD
jgi:hypothetical protein